MAKGPEQFVDHYALIQCSPDMSTAEVKKAYHSKLRRFHPDKRSGSSSNLGHTVTQALNEAWTVLQDPESRRTYDDTWRGQQKAPLSPQEQAEVHRQEGNELFRAARDLSGAEGTSSAVESKYCAAIERYSAGILVMPTNHLLWGNRATCFAVLNNWARCQEDAQRVTELQPTSPKGWILVVKSLCRLGAHDDARRQTQLALKSVPDNQELLALQAELIPELCHEVADVRPEPKAGVPSEVPVEVSSSDLLQGPGEEAPDTKKYMDSIRTRWTFWEAQELPRRPHSASRTAPQLFQARVSAGAGCAGAPPRMDFQRVSPISTPANSSRSSTPMPPAIDRKLPVLIPDGCAPFFTPMSSRASTPDSLGYPSRGRSAPAPPEQIARPSSAPAPGRLQAQVQARARSRLRSKESQNPNCGTSPAPPVATSCRRAAPGPGPSLASKESHSLHCARAMKQSCSLSSLAASSRMGLKMGAGGSRPVSAGSCRSRSSSAVTSETRRAWSK